MHLSQLRVVHTNPMKNFQAYLWWPSFVKPQVNTFFTLTPFFSPSTRNSLVIRSQSTGPKLSGVRAPQKMRPTYFLSPVPGPRLFVGLFYPGLRLRPCLSRYRSVHTLPHTRTHPTGIRSIYVKMEKMRHFSSKIERKHSAPAARADTVLRTQQNK